MYKLPRLKKQQQQQQQQKTLAWTYVDQSPKVMSRDQQGLPKGSREWHRPLNEFFTEIHLQHLNSYRLLTEGINGVVAFTVNG